MEFFLKIVKFYFFDRFCHRLVKYISYVLAMCEMIHLSSGLSYHCHMNREMP